MSAWQGTDDEAKARTLQSEFQASIQAVVAAATALDATYASVSKLIQIPADEREAWRRNRKARSAQVSEVLRRAFCIGEDQAKRMREDLKEIYRVRDLAVHPAAEMKPFVSHSEMNVLVEWQFDLYRASKAIMVVAGAGQILWVLAHNTKPTLPAIKNFASNMKIYLQELYPKGEPALPH